MTKDLPDFQSEIVSAAVEATAFRSGLDADKPASPAAGDIWLARDTLILYVCCVAGAWTGFDAAQLVQGILTLYADLAGGGFKLTGIGAPTAATDAARKSEVDTVDAKLDDVTQTRHITTTRTNDTIYQNTSGKIRVCVLSFANNVEVSGGVVECDAAATPTTEVARWYVGTADVHIAPVCFVVPPSYYYRMRVTGGSIVWYEWMEYDLL